MEKQVEIIVEGKVQGVYFRKSTKEIANLLDLCGYVKNQPNGTVLIRVCGTEAQIDQLITWCKMGPPSATVKNIKVEQEDIENYNSFEIR